jgi:molybdopterin-containing oxidoreductase family membrane subunit
MATLTKEDLHYLHPELVQGGKTYSNANTDITRPVESFPTKLWNIAFGVSLCVFLMYLFEAGNTIAQGMGLVGVNVPVGWGTFIINFVFWIGIGHAGTLISAILFVFRQQWRTGINRSAEAMTIFSVMTAASFILLHVGRTWVIFWGLPIPNERGVLWPNFRSPLAWDEFAISTYFITSLVFWYIGLVPDFASIRDRIDASTTGQKVRKVSR